MTDRTIAVITGDDRATRAITVDVRDDGPGVPQDTGVGLFGPKWVTTDGGMPL